ncbi:unnamed protein product [Rhizophagus irregularis]|nr:unnamed protein product [Rhizophagus irregularis]
MQYKGNIIIVTEIPELHDTSTIFNAYGEGFHLKRVLVSCLLKAAESQHDRFITIIRDSMTKLLLVENDDEEKYWKVSISNNKLTIHGSILIDASAAFEKIYRT